MSGIPWLSLTLAAPTIGLAYSLTSANARQQRRAAYLFSALALVAATGALLATPPDGLRDTLIPALHIDELSCYLLPFAALLTHLVLLLSPTAHTTPQSVRRAYLGEVLLFGTFLTRSPAQLALWWTASLLIIRPPFAGAEHRPTRAVLSLYLGSSALLFALGVAVLPAPLAGSALVAAVLIRKGVFPFHGWAPILFERAPLGTAIALNAPQVAAYAAVVALLPVASSEQLAALEGLSLFTAVYASALSLVQVSPRRAFGFLFASQSALVLAGLGSSSVQGITGGLSLWLSSGLALAGFGLTIELLEARRGPLRLDRLNGGYASMPFLAMSFLALGLASVGFPGTLGFVGHELLVEAATRDYPAIGFAVVVALVFNSISVMRMFLSLFYGSREGELATPLRRRELAAAGGLVALLLLGGLWPAPFVASRERVAHSLHRAHEAMATPRD